MFMCVSTTREPLKLQLQTLLNQVQHTVNFSILISHGLVNLKKKLQTFKEARKLVRISHRWDFYFASARSQKNGLFIEGL